jgi:hypothetical protein
MKDGWAQKHKWEQPFRVVPISSLLNCFSRGVRLRLSWLAAFRSLFMLSHFERFTFNPSLSGFAFYSIAFQLSFRLFLSDLPSGTESFTEYRLVVHHLRSELLTAWEHLQLCSFGVSPEIA